MITYDLLIAFREQRPRYWAEEIEESKVLLRKIMRDMKTNPDKIEHYTNELINLELEIDRNNSML